MNHSQDISEMTRRRKADRSQSRSSIMSVRQDGSTRRRNAPNGSPVSAYANGSPIMAKEIDAAPSLELAAQGKYPNSDRPTWSRIIAFVGGVIYTTIPTWFNFGVMVSLIFGGCCSNVRETRIMRMGDITELIW